MEVVFISTLNKSVDVDVDVSTAYNQWTQFESFPQFMDGVEWITEQTPDQVIAWRSTDGDTGGHSGRVTFDPLGPSSTRVDIALGREPEGLVEKAGAALNFDQRQVEKSAEDFKDFIEGRGRETGAGRGISTERSDEPAGRLVILI
jgi:uncharacterized membrane protein